jgi:hypothetical protein
MHLRTAYLPELGTPLVCRFDGPTGSQIVAEGSVVWRDEQEHGGEFGIHFTSVDGGSAEALLELCGVRAADGGEAAAPVAPGRGTKVRLHIDGLGSPMKARIREGDGQQVKVGSNLEFLRVGRSIELEDVAQGRKRAAHIERVEVEVDPASRVPQLVVALAFTDAPQTARAAAETTPDPVVIEPSERRAAADPATKVRTAIEAASDPMADDEALAAEAMKSGLSRAATRVGPALLSLGARAKTTLALLAARAKNEPVADAAEEPRRRTTAPPPGGALHASGKKVVRGEQGEQDEEGADPFAPPPLLGGKLRKRAMLAGGVAGVAVVLLATVALRKPQAAPPGDAAAEATSATAAVAAAVPGDVANAAATTPGAAALSPELVQANVPLYGPTTLSTTEPAPPPVPSAPTGAPDPLAAAATGGAQLPAAFDGPSAAPAPAGEPSFDEPDEPAREPRPRASQNATAKVAPFVHGKVTRPTLLKLRMDGAIEKMHGARTATGFTVTLPGRRSMAAAAGLASRDSRIASAKVSNGARGAELSVQFKDGAPPFAVRAKGRDLVIALGRDGAKDAKEGAKHPPMAKKGRAKHGDKVRGKD